MDCPACQTANAEDAVICAACGRALKSSRRRSEARRRAMEVREAAAVDTNNPAAWRAYRVALWSLMPGLGLVLGPIAIVLGWRAVRQAGDDLSARYRSIAAVLFGVLITLTQWIGVTLLIYNWRA
jgi:hypothetical protein